MRYAISVDPEYAAGLSEAQENEAEGKAIRAVLDLAPPEHREHIRDVLQNRSAIPQGAEDPVIAAHLSRIASIRAARAARIRQKNTQDEAAFAADREHRVRVRLVLVPTLPATRANAVVIRQPGDEGVPTILVPDDATAEDVDLGVRAGIRLADQLGLEVSERRSLVVRTSKSPRSRQPSSVAFWSQALADLKRMKSANLPGIGLARVMEVLASRSE